MEKPPGSALEPGTSTWKAWSAPSGRTSAAPPPAGARAGHCDVPPWRDPSRGGDRSGRPGKEEAPEGGAGSSPRAAPRPEEHHLRSEKDGCTRLVLGLCRLEGRELVEAVAIPRQEDLALCVSSQAGCALACSFCATGILGFRANLTAGEIVEQHAWAERIADRRVTDVVFMGMGEPLPQL